MKNKPARALIAIDVDDVLSNQKQAIIAFSNKYYGTSLTLDDFKQPGEYWGYWEMIWNVDAQEGNKRLEEFIKSDFSTKQETVRGSISVIEQLKHDYNLEVVTSRAPESYQLTKEWMQEHYPDTFRDIHFTSLWHKDGKATKAEICEAIGAGFLIDDNVEHCRLAAEAGVQPLLFGEYGWNMHQELPANITRVKNWQEVKDYFKRGTDKQPV